jgi:hypothetical protein
VDRKKLLFFKKITFFQNSLKINKRFLRPDFNPKSKRQFILEFLSQSLFFHGFHLIFQLVYRQLYKKIIMKSKRTKLGIVGLPLTISSKSVEVIIQH